MCILSPFSVSKLSTDLEVGLDCVKSTSRRIGNRGWGVSIISLEWDLSLYYIPNWKATKNAPRANSRQHWVMPAKQPGWVVISASQVAAAAPSFRQSIPSHVARVTALLCATVLLRWSIEFVMECTSEKCADRGSWCLS